MKANLMSSTPGNAPQIADQTCTTHAGWWPGVDNRYDKETARRFLAAEAWTYSAASRPLDREATQFRLCPPLIVMGLSSPRSAYSDLLISVLSNGLIGQHQAWGYRVCLGFSFSFPYFVGAFHPLASLLAGARGTAVYPGFAVFRPNHILKAMCTARAPPPMRHSASSLLAPSTCPPFLAVT